MNISELVPTVQNRLQFTYEFHKFAPSEAGCYVLTTFDGQVLYVGLTEDLKRRFGEHRDNKDKCALTIQGRASWFYYLVLDQKEIYRVERAWLNGHLDAHGVLPILNKINSPVS